MAIKYECPRCKKSYGIDDTGYSEGDFEAGEDMQTIYHHFECKGCHGELTAEIVQIIDVTYVFEGLQMVTTAADDAYNKAKLCPKTGRPTI